MKPPLLVEEMHWLLLTLCFLGVVLIQYALAATSKELFEPDFLQANAKKRQNICRGFFAIGTVILIFLLVRIFRALPPASSDWLTWWGTSLGYFVIGGFIFYLLRKTWDTWENSYDNEFYTYEAVLSVIWLVAILIDKINETLAQLPLSWIGAIALVAFGALILRDLGRR